MGAPPSHEPKSPIRPLSENVLVVLVWLLELISLQRWCGEWGKSHAVESASACKSECAIMTHSTRCPCRRAGLEINSELYSPQFQLLAIFAAGLPDCGHEGWTYWGSGPLSHALSVVAVQQPLKSKVGFLMWPVQYNEPKPLPPHTAILPCEPWWAKHASNACLCR